MVSGEALKRLTGNLLMKRSLLHAQRGQQRSAALYPVGWAATLAALMLLFAGCEKAGPTSQSTATPSSDAVDSSGSGRAGITTKSGVKMVLLPGGEFTMGSDRGSPDAPPR